MSKPTELAWAAGLFDGEGTAHFAMDKSLRHSPRAVGQPRLYVAQREREVLDRFAAAVGCGKVYGPYSRATSCAMYQWGAYNLAAFEQTVDLLWPYLSAPKRTQIKGVVALYEEQDFTRPSNIGRRRSTAATIEHLVTITGKA